MAELLRRAPGGQNPDGPARNENGFVIHEKISRRMQDDNPDKLAMSI